MAIFETLADPVRRHLLELLAQGERTSGELAASARDRFGISQPATSQHLKVLRDTELVLVRVDGPRRIYAVNTPALDELHAWLAQFHDQFAQPLDALGTELARGKRQRRRSGPDRRPGEAAKGA
ncbi:ArsR/SmtB family transcription factor [Microlunatus speluncae]|uniref:ArsR/SmtB family transcription factor n=1 Tax=Microlunatus speluncae TaxID=2594267 RepID=UPI001266288D|nr:metalloregulator ArsR/SmtB family transcription factor [Microlunatus speluncae]